jgi:hypothetical protein
MAWQLEITQAITRIFQYVSMSRCETVTSLPENGLENILTGIIYSSLLQNIMTASGAHQASYSVSIRDLFRG